VNIVEVRGADKVYADGTRALARVDLSLGAGEFVSVVGPSGCGKSTMLRLVARLLEPTQGRLVWWGGGFERVGEPGRRVAFVFQDPTLMPWASVRGNVRLPLDLAGIARGAAEARVSQALARVGLGRFAHALPRQLSGGMRMRASIARALVTEPDLLLMDEPFGALDEFTRNRLDQELLDLWRQRELTVLFVTHSIHEAVFLSTRVVVMAARPGRVIGEVPVDEPYPRGDVFRVSRDFVAQARQVQELLAQASALGEPAAH